MATKREIKEVTGAIGVLAFLVLLLIGVLWGLAACWKYYNVWSQSMQGKALLAEAEYSRQIAVREAEAFRDSATLRAEAEIIRARGVAESNSIIADGLGGPEGYLRYLYIQGIADTQNAGAQVIYIPTEAGLPILEAGRVNRPQVTINGGGHD